MEGDFKVYKYRWVILFLFLIVNIILQAHWLILPSIASDVKDIYQVSLTAIDMVSVIFMIVFIFVSIPASYVIDTWGLKIGVGIGAVLIGFFGLFKGFYAESYTAVLIAQFGISLGQPFILNATTKVSAQWFPFKERATAAGLIMMSQLFGILITMLTTPFFFKAYGLNNLMMFWGVISAVGAILFLVFCRKSPPTPPCLECHAERLTVTAGLKHIFKQRDAILMYIGFFFGLGIFNAIVTWIEQLITPRGFNAEQAGIAGAMIMISGIIGGFVIPRLSDMKRKRKLFIVLGIIGAIPGLCGFAFAHSYWLLLLSAAIYGFFGVGSSPVSYQYLAEVSYPAPEATSQGLLIFVGNLSGILFILIPDFLLEPSVKQPAMMLFIALFFVILFINLLLKESRHMVTEHNQ